jgi:polyadenylate-binding protein
MSITAAFESRGYGFVEFATVEEAKKAVEAMNGKEIESPPSGQGSSSGSEESKENLVLSVNHFESKRLRIGKQGQEATCSANLYVKNFPPSKFHHQANDSDAASDESQGEFNDSDLVELFRPFGEILSAAVMKDGDGKSRGFGFVCFVNW